VSLAVLELRSVVHGDVLHGGQGARPAKLDLAHVANVEEAHTGANGHVLGNKAATRPWVLDWHVPAAEVHHLGLEGAVGGVEGGLLESCGDWRGDFGHEGDPFSNPALPFTR
jgi:hypothetical protein